MTNLKHNHIFLIEDLIVAARIMCNTTFANRLLTQYRIQDDNTEYRIQDTEYRIQDTEYRIQSTGRPCVKIVTSCTALSTVLKPQFLNPLKN